MRLRDSPADKEVNYGTRVKQRGRASHMMGHSVRIGPIKLDSCLGVCPNERPRLYNIKKHLCHYLYCWQVRESPVIIGCHIS